MLRRRNYEDPVTALDQTGRELTEEELLLKMIPSELREFMQENPRFWQDIKDGNYSAEFEQLLGQFIAAKMGKEMVVGSTYTIYVQLNHFKPAIWRCFEISGGVVARFDVRHHYDVSWEWGHIYMTCMIPTKI
ncbi:hypothetical protein GTO87_09100 [Ligilactobacillus saerimneri]|uniref:Uncharacterized protein n=1 Tax=Ligilactobacillus saerimneri TaxID=228229 RepID=A0A7H9EN55_9LACO|nr:hypothetical protein [Ligilactobacillus saerimneri]QLL78727.1 hypothetical protein GTO87_09100 [Ligilactobacillus saerimneri]